MLDETQRRLRTYPRCHGFGELWSDVGQGEVGPEAGAGMGAFR